jgi:hypothetical protein
MNDDETTQGKKKQRDMREQRKYAVLLLKRQYIFVVEKPNLNGVPCTHHKCHQRIEESMVGPGKPVISNNEKEFILEVRYECFFNATRDPMFTFTMHRHLKMTFE